MCVYNICMYVYVIYDLGNGILLVILKGRVEEYAGKVRYERVEY